MPNQPPQQVSQAQSPKKLNKTVLIVVIAGVIALAGLIYVYFFIGITGGQKYNICARECEDLLGCKVKCSKTYNAGPYKDSEFYCNWIWPQEIIIKGTEDTVYKCTHAKPWCDPSDGTYEKASCCESYDETTQQKIGCTTLQELLE